MKKTVQELHEENLLTNSPIKLYLVHKFDPTIKSWKFTGYRCVYCGSSFKHEATIHKHRNICKELTKPNKRSYGADNPELIIDNNREVWNSKYINPE